MGAEMRSAFAEAAAADGIVLERASFDWLCEQGHVGLERVARARRDPAIVAPAIAALAVLGRIFAHLRGDVTVLHAARGNLLLPCDLVHGPTGMIVEVDGPEHFTSARPAALELYPSGAPVGFAIAEHAALCRDLRGRTDLLSRGRRWSGSPRPTRTARPRMPATATRSRRARPADQRLRLPGSCSSVADTFTVRQRPQRTRTR
jgi:hypothetical protein